MTDTSLSEADKRAHRHLTKEAKRLNASFGDALKGAGAVAMPKARRGSLFMVLARAIVGQQLSAKVAARLWERIEEGFSGSDLPLHFFIESWGEKNLRGVGLSGGKVSFLLDLCAAKRSGHLSARRILRMAHEDRIKHLTEIRGIGPWTADMVGIFYCLDEDVWPQGDLAVRATMSLLSGKSEESLPKLVEDFRPYRSYLALQMWRLKNARPA